MLSLFALSASLVALHGQSFHFTPNASIPDPSVSGLTDTRIVTTPTTAIADLNISLVIAGDSFAANGDYYATLTHDSGFAVLLNRLGRRGDAPLGYADNGLNIRLDDQAPNGDVHIYRLTLFGNHNTPVDVSYETPLMGTWAPDGRAVPFSSVTDSSPRTPNPLASFNGLNPNGSWTLFVADVSAGGSGTLVSWTLEITAVPEPPETATVVGILIFGGFLAFRRRNRHTP